MKKLGFIVGLLLCVGTWADPVPSFRNTIQPILTKHGCSSGPCHGAAAGKNGFILSLRGYDDLADWQVLKPATLQDDASTQATLVAA